MYIVEDINSNGNGVIRRNNKATFVPFTITGEKIECETIKSGKNFDIAKLTNIIEESDERVNPDCLYYTKCGSCNLLHMAYKKQLETKQAIVQSAINRIGKLNINVETIIPSPAQFEYRNKASFPVSEKGFGYYENQSHNIVNIDNCKLVHPKIIKVFTLIKPFVLQHNNIISHVVIKHMEDNTMITIVSNGKTNFNQQLIDILSPYVTSINININKNSKQILGNKTTTIWGKSTIPYSILGNTFKISAQSFAQINTPCATKLYELALSKLDLTGKTVIDAYCGIGTISLALSKKAKYVYGIELIQKAIDDANIAKVENNINNISFVCDRCENYIPKLINQNKSIDAIVLDPPRQGLEKTLIDCICNHNIPYVIYISCSAQTLARDLNEFSNNRGYVIESITPVDMFPNTSHVETCVLLSHKNS